MIRLLCFSLLSLSLSSCSFLSTLEGVREAQAPLTVRWAKNLDPVYETGNLPIHLGAPAVDSSATRLFMADGSGHMTAYSLENGRDLWQVNDGGTSHAGATYFEDVLYYGTSEGRLISRNSSNGDLNWSIDLGASVESSPTISGGRLFIQLRNHQIFALDAATGKILWAYKRSVPLLTTLQRASKPRIWKNKLYIGFADGSVAAFNIEEGLLLWERKISNGDKFVDVDMTPTFFNEQLWVGSSSNDMHVLDPKNGRTVRTLSFISGYEPLKLGESLIFGTSNGELIGVNNNGKTIFKYKVSEHQISSVSNWKNGFVATDVEGNMYFVGSEEGKVLWSHHLGHEASGIFAGPVLTKSKLALLSSRNRLYIFE